MAIRQPPSDPVPDLFAQTRDKGPAPRVATPESRTVFPANLPSTLTRLPESDLKQLAEAVAVEMRRRNLVTAPADRGAPAPEKPKSKRMAIEPDRDEEDRSALPPGKLNAIKAAVKAGVKPMTIAKQFGVSLSAIKKVLEGKR